MSKKPFMVLIMKLIFNKGYMINIFKNKKIFSIRFVFEINLHNKKICMARLLNREREIPVIAFHEQFG